MIKVTMKYFYTHEKRIIDITEDIYCQDDNLYFLSYEGNIAYANPKTISKYTNLSIFIKPTRLIEVLYGEA